MNNNLSIIGHDVWSLIIEFFGLNELKSFMQSCKFFKKIIDDMPLKHIKCFKLDSLLMYWPMKLYKLFTYAPKQSLWLNKFKNYVPKSSQYCYFWKPKEKNLIIYILVKSIMEEDIMIFTLLLKYYYMENITFDVLSNIFVLLMINSSNELDKENKINNMDTLNKYFYKLNTNFNFNFDKNVKINMYFVLPILMRKFGIVKTFNEYFDNEQLNEHIIYKQIYAPKELNIIRHEEDFCNCPYYVHSDNLCLTDHSIKTILFSWADICKQYNVEFNLIKN